MVEMEGMQKFLPFFFVINIKIIAQNLFYIEKILYLCKENV